MKDNPSPTQTALRIFALLAGLAGLPSVSAATVTHFPGADWEWYASPEDAGFSSQALAAVREASEKLDTAALMIVHRGRVVDAWGDLETEFNCHSIRKSLLSALYGIQVEQGVISLDATIGELGIDDNDPLSETEKKATVRMLLQARSGVYHPALYETKAMAARRPARHAHEPGTFHYYNNWDFNVLGTIYEKETGEKIHASFEHRIGRPIGMVDFTADDGDYVTGEASRHAAYPFRMSARDLARFGLLFLNSGNWAGKQIVPASWVEESTRSYSDTGSKGGYGYLWWIAVAGRHFADNPMPEGTYTGRGNGGHVVAVVPSHDLVVVHRVNTFERGNRVEYDEFGALLAGILKADTNARPAPHPAIEVQPGSGVFTYTGDEVHADLEMRVFYHAPEKIEPATPVWFIIHGAGRDAQSYFDGWEPHIREGGALVLVPEFTKERFPASRAFNLGNIKNADDTPRPQREWTYAILERLFDRVRADLGLETGRYLIYGHSAGSQFAHRMLFFLDETRAAGAVLANAGWYTMPRFDIAFPYGLGGMDVTPEQAERVFQLPVVVLLGDQDIDENHSQLLRTKEAMAQGPHRLARGENFYQTARAQAELLGVPFAWRCERVPGVAHSNRGMAATAARHLRGMSEM